MEQRCQGTLQVWAEPFIAPAVPKFFNLRTDPLRVRGHHVEHLLRWFIHHAYIARTAQADRGQVRGDLQGLPADPEAEHFTIDDAMAKMQKRQRRQVDCGRRNGGRADACYRVGHRVLGRQDGRNRHARCHRLVCRSRGVSPRSASPAHSRRATDPLPSWNDGAAKKSIVDFVAQRDEGGRPGLRARRRSASPSSTTTARCGREQPIYFQLAFALDRVKALAPQHPEWKTKQPFKRAPRRAT